MGRLTIVYGGQYGSEGKGQIVAYLSGRRTYSCAVRVGGPNAGHTFMLPNGIKQVVQTIPSSLFINKNVSGIIGASGIIHEEIFLNEAESLKTLHGRSPIILLDESVALITKGHMAEEAMLKGRIGSTGEGVGAVTASRVMRDPRAVLGELHNYKRFMESLDSRGLDLVSISPDTALDVNMTLRNGFNIIVEGTQGVELSLCTSGHYPYCTSRECTPQGILSQAGISVENATQVEKIMVVRTYPIRVGGNSGPISGEITWEELGKLTNGYVKEPEITTVTRKPRRIAKIDYDRLLRAVIVTRPTAIALTFFDYWFPEIATATDPSALSPEMWDAINIVEKQLGVQVKFLSTGFGSVIPLRVTL